MALSSTDPVGEGSKTPAVKSSKLPPALGRASESGDAGVHFLLAQRQTHASNGDDEAVKAVDLQLADLGFAV